MKPVVVITGAAGGIGSATAAAFAAAGWHVVGIDQQSPDEPPADTHQFIAADIADEAASQTIFEELATQVGRLDALVNNAAIQISKPLIETTPAEWDTLMAVNLRAAYLAIRHAYPLLRQSGGAIVNVSSVHAVATSANIAAYAASKGGLLALTRALAIELAPDQIRVNAVLPGAVDTPMLRDGLGRGHLAASDVDTQMNLLAQRTVNGRVGQPAEIAEAILFLADSRRSSFMTGQSLVIDGGATARLSTE
jgi:NAD(P)-dependent dehydrogenase (short-subunit alcohol dehydrogenase family)